MKRSTCLSFLLPLAMACGGSGSSDDDGAGGTGQGGASGGAAGGTAGSSGGSAGSSGGMGGSGAGGSAGSAGDCDFTACGGDITGTWNLTSACGLSAIFGDPTGGACPGFASDDQGLSLTGTVSFNADMSYDLTTMVSGNVNLMVPLSCLPPMSACSDLDVAVSGTCTDDNGVCDCAIPLDTTDNESGTWSTSGNQLTTTSMGTDEVGEYCVEGNSLTVRDVDGVVFTATR